MKKVVFVSGDGVLIEAVTAILNSRKDLNFQLLSTSRIETLASDIECFRASTVIIDATYYGTEQANYAFMKYIKSISTVRECLLLMDENNINKQLAGQMIMDNWIDDYIVYDNSLEGLFDRLMK